MVLCPIEKEIQTFYEKLWADPQKIKRDGDNLQLGWHYGFYNTSTKNQQEAIKNMIYYLDRLLDIDMEQPANILDAGCGIGYTTLYLAKKYPHCRFYGISLAANEIKHAESLKKQFSLNNVSFSQKSYMNSGFKDNSFDRIFTLESAVYAPNKQRFLNEIYRLLKSSGKLVVLDTFPEKYLSSSFRNKINNYIQQRQFSELEIKQYYVPINRFEQYLHSEGFHDIVLKNLVASGNVRKSHLYGYIFFRSMEKLLKGPSSKYHSNFVHNIRNKLMFPINSLILVFFGMFLILYVKPRYYAIEAQKSNEDKDK